MYEKATETDGGCGQYTSELHRGWPQQPSKQVKHDIDALKPSRRISFAPRNDSLTVSRFLVDNAAVLSNQHFSIDVRGISKKEMDYQKIGKILRLRHSCNSVSFIILDKLIHQSFEKGAFCALGLPSMENSFHQGYVLGAFLSIVSVNLG